MRLVEKTRRVSRRHFLSASTATVFGTVAISSGTMLLDPRGAWAMPLKSLKPQTMATLIQMARDTYPHDRLTDAVYAKSVADYDDKAAADPAVKAMLENGCAMLDKKARLDYNVNYVDVGWEEQRTGILRDSQNTEFFQTIRGGLITGLYNQHDIWMKFGYEGASADKGGYLHRGFNDIDWLPKVQTASVEGSKS
jgi:hypothetical protein